MASKTISTGYEPRRVFRPFHARPQRWACLVAHRRCGKTVACVADLVDAALRCKRPNGRFAYIAPLYKQAKDVSWQYVKDMVSDLVANGMASINETELRVDLWNGARVRLYGADNPDALRGIYLDGVVLDEYADMNPRMWSEVIRPALADRKGFAVFIGTPKGRNAFYSRWMEAQTSDDWFALMLRASETRIVDVDELAAARKEMTEDQYAQEFECSFEAAILGAYYGRDIIRAEQEGRVTSVPYDPNLPVHTIQDIGFSDDTAILFFQVANGEVRIIDHYKNSGEGVQHYAEVILGKPYRYGTHWLPHDANARMIAAAGRTVAEQYRDAGLERIQVLQNKQTEQQGIMAARLMIGRVWFDAEKCAGFLEALRQFQREWDDEQKCFKDKPKHDWTNHDADAFRYLAWVWREPTKQPEKPANKIIQIGGKSTATFNDMLNTVRKRNVTDR